MIMEDFNIGLTILVVLISLFLYSLVAAFVKRHWEIHHYHISEVDIMYIAFLWPLTMSALTIWFTFFKLPTKIVIWAEDIMKKKERDSREETPYRGKV